MTQRIKQAKLLSTRFLSAIQAEECGRQIYPKELCYSETKTPIFDTNPSSFKSSCVTFVTLCSNFMQKVRKN